MASSSGAAALSTDADPGLVDRALWVAMLTRIAGPVLRSLAARTLKLDMPIEGVGDPRYDRKHFSHLEALARTLLGLAPWLECPPGALTAGEEALRGDFAALARDALDAATDPASADALCFTFSF